MTKTIPPLPPPVKPACQPFPSPGFLAENLGAVLELCSLPHIPWLIHRKSLSPLSFNYVLSLCASHHPDWHHPSPISILSLQWPLYLPPWQCDTSKSQSGRIIPLLKNLHWLPIVAGLNSKPLSGLSRCWHLSAWPHFVSFTSVGQS